MFQALQLMETIHETEWFCLQVGGRSSFPIGAIILMQLLEVSQPAILIPLFPDFGAGGTVQRAEQPVRPRRGLPPAKEDRRVRCQVGG